MVKGYFLIETFIVLSIISLLTLMGFTLLPNLVENLQMKYYTYNLYQFIGFGRTLAQALDEDIELKIKNEKIILISNFDQKILQSQNIPLNFKLSLSHSLGFTSQGQTKYAGSLIVQSKNQTNKITVGVGYGQINIK